ncbi:hypothetical protein NKDENANG_02695 [Candidatus Entotheonellaceae bacterium PAL068K]
MADAEQMQAPASSEDASLDAGWLPRAVGPVLLAAAGVVALAVLIVFTSKSAWVLLGAGRGVVGTASYPYTGLLVILGTTFGLFVGWAVGSALLVYGWQALGSATTLSVVQVCMSIVFCLLAMIPISFYHLLFGQSLAGLPRPGVATWVRQTYPDAYWLLFPGHWVTDLLMIPLLIAVLVLLWGGGEERWFHHWGMQTLGLFLILLAFFAVALSLGIHATLAHIHLG